jgi:hypothetical protein
VVAAAHRFRASLFLLPATTMIVGAGLTEAPLLLVVRLPSTPPGSPTIDARSGSVPKADRPSRGHTLVRATPTSERDPDTPD